MGRLLRHTIWEPGAIPPNEKKYGTPLKRFALPMFDLVCVVSGIFAVTSGVPAFEAILPPLAADILGYLFAITAFACFLGVAIPHLWRVEIGSKVLLFALMGMYCLSLLTLGTAGGSSRYFVAGIVAAAMLIPLLRLWILGTEIRDRKFGIGVA